MSKFRFQLQNCIDVEIEADNVEDARMMILDNMEDYAHQMVDMSCYVSDGVEISSSKED